MEAFKNMFLINPKVTYLNFGSFGACPKPIFEDYQQWQLVLESEPVQFIAVHAAKYLQTSREALAGYIGCDVADVVYVTNPTYAINIVAKSFPLVAGDEILSTDLEYGAMDRTWNYYCQKAGARLVRQPIQLPVVSKQDIIDQFWEGYTEKTKAIFISHITSSTALILPVEEICAMAKERGLITIVDGAHTPGHIPLDLSTLQADIYTGACHKWMMTPKGCSFLYVKRDLQQLFDPLLISWGYQSTAPSPSQFLDYHEMQGTRDFSAFLTVPKAIAFRQQYDWTMVAGECRKMIQENYSRLCNLLGSMPLSPVNDAFLGQMASIPIITPAPEALKAHLFDTYKIEIPVMRHGEQVYLRYSINAFNTQQDLDYLYNALQEIVAEGNLLEA